MMFQCLISSLVDLAALVWAGQGMYTVFNNQNVSQGFFYNDIINRQEASLESLGGLGSQLVVVLAIAVFVIFLLVGSGIKAVAKISMVLVPACFMLLSTLTIRYNILHLLLLDNYFIV